MAVWIEDNKCTGCRKCAKVCPYGAVEVQGERAVLKDNCIECGVCLRSCKFGAICSDLVATPIPDLSGYRGVWVFAEQRGGMLSQTSLELLGCATGLAQSLGQEVAAVLVGDQVSGLAASLTASGADKVYLVENRGLGHYRPLPYVKVLADLVSQYRPNIFLLGATHVGRDLAPRLSARLDLGLTADCTELTIDPKSKNLYQTRPAFGGNVMAVIESPRTRPQMATVRPGIMKALTPDSARRGEVIRHQADLVPKDLRTRILEIVKEQKQRVDLTAARIIVGVGRGACDAEGIKLLSELAWVMGAEIGGTRVAVEEGFVPPERQIGQTGVTVRPELYFACGISGAIQHRPGILNARYIVSINRDRQAPIFEVSDYAVKADLFDVVPKLIDVLKREPA
ncbi:MAG: electron transfer flavoprotein subunit alpha [Deltaproteobacteria bacterium]|nr:electron transfer flavoprotein subunit alpha [Deltaproteobacteria bacterium]